MVLNRVMPLAAGLLLFAIGCTPGAESASSGAVPAGAPSSVVTIDVNLTAESDGHARGRNLRRVRARPRPPCRSEAAYDS